MAAEQRVFAAAGSEPELGATPKVARQKVDHAEN
jgi:hypothetical protein